MAGTLIILYAVGVKYFTVYTQDKVIKNYEKKIKDSSKLPESSKNNGMSPKNYGTLGILDIPKIDLKVAIQEGTDLDTLKYAVGHFKDTSLPGQKGNFALAGHRSYTYGEYFNRLDELKIGDEIIVETVKGTYQYEVYNIKVVLPEDVEVLNSTEDATMTLITCTPIRVGTHRLIVSARLY